MSKRAPWPSLLRAHLDRRGFLQDDFAAKVGVTQAQVSYYINGKVDPPLAKLTEFADVLELRGSERETFIEEGYLAHAPEVVRCLVASHKSRIARLERLCRDHGLKFE